MYCLITVSQYISKLMLQQFTIITIQYIIHKFEKSKVFIFVRTDCSDLDMVNFQHHNFGFEVNPH